MVRERLLRALSIRQPHSELILIGKKKLEFRGRLTHIRGRVYLYAGKKLDRDVKGIANEKAALLPRSAIVGSVEIVDCYESEEHPGYFAWELAKPRRYRSPRRARGVPQPGFWKPTFL
jgi:predicted transcriptional regulator